MIPTVAGAIPTRTGIVFKELAIPRLPARDHPAARRRLPSVRICRCYDRRRHRERLEPSTKPFRDSDRREPTSSHEMVVGAGLAPPPPPSRGGETLRNMMESVGYRGVGPLQKCAGACAPARPAGRQAGRQAGRRWGRRASGTCEFIGAHESMKGAV